MAEPEAAFSHISVAPTWQGVWVPCAGDAMNRVGCDFVSNYLLCGNAKTWAKIIPSTTKNPVTMLYPHPWVGIFFFY